MAMPTLQRSLEHFGIAVSAISGVLAARGKRIDLFGFLFSPWSPLSAAAPFAICSSAIFRSSGSAARNFFECDEHCLLTFFTVRIWNLPHNVLLIADAFALALFSMLARKKALRSIFPLPSLSCSALLLGLRAELFATSSPAKCLWSSNPKFTCTPLRHSPALLLLLFW